VLCVSDRARRGVEGRTPWKLSFPFRAHGEASADGPVVVILSSFKLSCEDQQTEGAADRHRDCAARALGFHLRRGGPDRTLRLGVLHLRRHLQLALGLALLLAAATATGLRASALLSGYELPAGNTG
jgi:hypothetical protein